MASHLDGPATVLPPDTIYRIARSDGVLSFSRIMAEDADLPAAGNRFDVVGGGVLYAATTRTTCFAETLARYRVPPTVRAVVNEMDELGTYMVCASIPRDWRARRVIASLRLGAPLSFVDVDDLQTHEYLTSILASQLTVNGGGIIDGAAVRDGNRRITRAIARWAYTATDSDGLVLYSGIRYNSRLDNGECWAIFDGTDVFALANDVIEESNPDLRRVAATFNLRVF